MLSVFDGVFGAPADTGHAVGAVFAPYRLSVFKADIVQRTERRALPAGDAGVGGVKLCSVNK